VPDLESVLLAIAASPRRILLQRLAQGPATTGQLAELLPMSRPAVSQHIKVLQDAELIRTTVIGRHRWHELRPGPLRQIAGWAAEVADRAGNAPELRPSGEVHDEPPRQLRRDQQP
jgi:DNA-binding transcriptional ArsR family regulator